MSTELFKAMTHAIASGFNYVRDSARKGQSDRRERARGPYTSSTIFSTGCAARPSASRGFATSSCRRLRRPRAASDATALGLAGEVATARPGQGIAKQSELRLKGTAPSLPEID